MKIKAFFNRHILAENEIELLSLKDQQTFKRVYWLKDDKGVAIAGLTLKFMFLYDQV